MGNHNNSLLKKFGRAILNFVSSLVVGFLLLAVIVLLLTILLPPFNELSSESQELFNTFYQGYVTALGLGAFLAFFSAFKGFSLVQRIKSLIRKS